MMAQPRRPAFGRDPPGGAGRAGRTPSALTSRQLECVKLVGRGKTDWEISRTLGITEETVTSHLNEARRRYGVSRRSELPVHALYRGDLNFSDLLGAS